MSEAKGKQCKYLTIVGKNKETKDAESINDRVEDAKIQLDADIQQAKKTARQAQRTVESAIESTSFNSARIVEAKQEQELAEANHKALLALKEELF